jgi:hypothetical protein
MNYNYLGFPGGISARELRERGYQQLAEYPQVTVLKHKIASLQRANGLLYASTQSDRWCGRAVILCTGVADAHFSGKKRQHTLKGQVALDQDDGTVCDVAESVVGPTADVRLLAQSGLLSRLSEGVGAIGDLAYVGIAEAHPTGLGATPRRKPRGKDRPPEDVCFNRAFAKRRIKVEHTIGRMRRYQSLSQSDRHHRRNHTARTRAVAGLVNRQIGSRLPC